MEPFLQFPKLVYSALTQDLAPALKNFRLLMITLFRRVFCPESDGSDARPAVPHPAFKRADPMIYDQLLPDEPLPGRQLADSRHTASVPILIPFEEGTVRR